MEQLTATSLSKSIPRSTKLLCLYFWTWQLLWQRSKFIADTYIRLCVCVCMYMYYIKIHCYTFHSYWRTLILIVPISKNPRSHPSSHLPMPQIAWLLKNAVALNKTLHITWLRKLGNVVKLRHKPYVNMLKVPGIYKALDVPKMNTNFLVLKCAQNMHVN